MAIYCSAGKIIMFLCDSFFLYWQSFGSDPQEKLDRDPTRKKNRIIVRSPRISDPDQIPPKKNWIRSLGENKIFDSRDFDDPSPLLFRLNLDRTLRNFSDSGSKSLLRRTIFVFLMEPILVGS